MSYRLCIGCVSAESRSHPRAAPTVSGVHTHLLRPSPPPSRRRGEARPCGAASGSSLCGQAGQATAPPRQPEVWHGERLPRRDSDCAEAAVPGSRPRLVAQSSSPEHAFLARAHQRLGLCRGRGPSARRSVKLARARLSLARAHREQPTPVHTRRSTPTHSPEHARHNTPTHACTHTAQNTYTHA
jgi:hypothetical protein